MTIHLLIIDTQVQQNVEEVMRTSKKDNVLLLVYDSAVTDTCVKFMAKLTDFVSNNTISLHSLHSIGWGFHGYMENNQKFSLFKNSPTISYKAATVNDDGTKTFSDSLPFPNDAKHILPILAQMKELLVTENGRLDLFLCSMLNSPHKALFYYLETFSKINIAASSNTTGTSTIHVADWIMESESSNIDLTDVFLGGADTTPQQATENRETLVRNLGLDPTTLNV